MPIWVALTFCPSEIFGGHRAYCPLPGRPLCSSDFCSPNWRDRELLLRAPLFRGSRGKTVSPFRPSVNSGRRFLRSVFPRPALPPFFNWLIFRGTAVYFRCKDPPERRIPCIRSQSCASGDTRHARSFLRGDIFSPAIYIPVLESGSRLFVFSFPPFKVIASIYDPKSARADGANNGNNACTVGQLLFARLFHTIQ